MFGVFLACVLSVVKVVAIYKIGFQVFVSFYTLLFQKAQPFFNVIPIRMAAKYMLNHKLPFFTKNLSRQAKIAH